MSKTSSKLADKRAELDKLLAWFESDEFSIERAADKFKQAQELAADIEAELMEHKNTINVLKRQFDRE